MKITIITPTFPYPKRGIFPGVERYIENLAISLKKTGNDVKIVTTFWNGGKPHDIYKGIPLLRIVDSKALLGKLGSAFYLNYITFGLNLFRKHNFKFFKDSDVIISAFSTIFSFFFDRKCIPLISLFLHYDKIQKREDLLTYPILHLLQKSQYRRHRRIITISETSKLDLIEHYKLDKNDIISIPIGIDNRKFNPSNFSKEIKERFRGKLLFYSGLMISRKRIPVLLKAFQKVLRTYPNVHLVLAGDGPLLNHFKDLSKLYDINEKVTFLGFLDDTSLQKYYATSDIYVFPSEQEGFGQVILEAMASGTPVICADKPPMSVIVANGGLTFKLNNPNDLAKQILTLLKSEKLLEEMGNNALKITKIYTWDSITDKYLHFLKQSLAYPR
jgi:glycosyltransferase involved in cell wall biosynthesis